MSIADHFDHRPNVGFTRDDYAAQARRQFQVSLGLVCILAVAAVAVIFGMWLDGTISPSALPVAQGNVAQTALRFASGG